MINQLIYRKKIYDRKYRGSKAQIEAAKKFIRQVKARSRCIKCGEEGPWCLDFHHRDKKDKFMSISEMGKRGFPLQLIKKEIDLCECLCSNDHRSIHYKRFWLNI